MLQYGLTQSLTLRSCLSLMALLFSFHNSAVAASDARMQIEVLAKQQNVEVQWLHANIRHAADMALPQLWARMVPQHAHVLLPNKLKAIRFLQKATPTDGGVNITFNHKRVLNYLKKNNIPYYAEHSATTPIVQQPVYASPVGPPIRIQPSLASDKPLLLNIQRQASLTEQVLFEDELKSKPRILSLSLRQVSREGQQYLLRLKGSDDQWLTTWFKRRGMTLSPTIEGWVAH